MTNTETCMREMRHILKLFGQSYDFDQQWILFKAFLNTLHSLTDNDSKAKGILIGSPLIDFTLVLRNIVHHQPAKWHYSQHDVQPTNFSISYTEDSGVKMTSSYCLVIQKNTLEDEELQAELGRNSSKQLKALKIALKKIEAHVIVVKPLMLQIQNHIENYCREHNCYTDGYDEDSKGFVIVRN